MKRAVVAGCGFLGLKVARLLAQRDWDITGIVHTQASLQALSGESFPGRICDISDAQNVRQVLSDLRDVDAVVQCVSSGRGGVEQYRGVYLEGTRNLLEVLQPRRMVFTSSTSVYAQVDGSIVTEESEADPTRDTGKVLLETEALAVNSGGVAARLAGLYGPERSVLLRKFFDGSAVIEGLGDRTVNQIHRDDAASAMALLISLEVPGGLYNVSDDTPLRQIEIYEWLASRYGRTVPPCGLVNLNRKRGWTNKRVSNAKLRAAGWVPRYPSFKIAVLEDKGLHVQV